MSRYKGDDHDQHEIDDRSNNLNPNNDQYDRSRAEPEDS